MTRAPASTISRAVSAPIPRAAPVIRAILPSSRFMTALPLHPVGSDQGLLSAALHRKIAAEGQANGRFPGALVDAGVCTRSNLVPLCTDPLFRRSGAGKQGDGFVSCVIAAGKVALHPRRVPLRSGPVAAAARRLDRNPISGSQHVTFA